jgi:hypothetical protein
LEVFEPSSVQISPFWQTELSNQDRPKLTECPRFSFAPV